MPSPTSLHEQVRQALSTYALAEGRLRSMYEAHGLAWEEAGARRLVEAAAKQIGASVEGRGETSYSLDVGSAARNATRVASVHKYLEKLVKKKAESTGKR